MKSSLLLTAAFACSLASLADAQKQTPPVKKQLPPNISSPQGLPSAAFVGPNDLCANSTAIAGPGTYAFDNVGAGTDGPASCGAIAADVWFNWTATSTANTVVTTCSLAGFDTVLDIYATAACVGAPITCNDDFCGLQSRVTFAATAGSVYKIRVGGFGGAQGTGSFSVSALVAPPNDGCGSATAIAGAGPHAYDNQAASTGAEGQSEAICNFFGQTGITNDIWYAWTAGFTGTARLSVCGQGSNDTKVAIYPSAPACPPNGTSIACNDDVCGLQSQVDWAVTAGTVYRIQFGSYPGSSGGAGTFTIAPPPPPPANDGCAAPTAIAGAGPHNFDSTAATTGAEGQSEANCLFFGSTTIDSDQWFTWTAGATGQATISTCGQTGVDTKIAVYPGTPACPVNGSSLACNDDACGLQTSVCLNVTSGTSYTIQIGTYPGASGGSGTFTINVVGGGGSTCQHDDGSSENMLGWTAGGEMGWIQKFGGVGASGVTNVQVAWGSAMFPGLSPGNGSPAKVVLYEDPNDDGNPGDVTLTQLLNVAVANVDTDMLNSHAVTPVNMNGVFFAGAGEIHPSGNYVAVMDQSSVPCGDVAWFFGNNNATPVDYANVNNNAFPPATFSGIGFPCALLVRAGCNVSPMVQVCLPGQGGIIACPCGNPPAGGGLGCNNFGAGPAQSGTLAASGTASLGADTVVLQASGENNTALTVFWQGRDPLHPTGVAHAAGVRCVTQTLKRLYTGNASAGAISRPGMGDPTVSARSAAVGDPILAGQNRHYFTIYRDPSAAGPCGNTSSTVNLTNAGTIAWAP